jgi:signal transduction histidine kinase
MTNAASASATSAPTNAALMRVREGLLRVRDRSAPVVVAGTRRIDVALASAGVEAHQRFLAYAAHELRGGLALQRTLAEVALADPDADTAALRTMGERVVVACERQERLLAALLTLSRSGSGRLRREPVDLAVTAAEALRTHDHHGLGSTTALDPARTTADPQLIERLVANLVANAVRHNIPGGRLDIATYSAAGRATFAIANTGPLIPAGELPRLFEPFQRLTAHAGTSTDGVGLGLAIVQAIATAHDATITAYPRAGGGLGIDVAFPALD